MSLLLDFFFSSSSRSALSPAVGESLVLGLKSGVGASGVQSPLGHKSTSLLA